MRIKDLKRFDRIPPFIDRARLESSIDLPIRFNQSTSSWTDDLDGTSDYLYVISSSFSGTLTLPTGSSLVAGDAFLIKKAINNVSATLARAGTDTIDGQASYLMLKSGEAAALVWNGQEWSIS